MMYYTHSYIVSYVEELIKGYQFTEFKLISNLEYTEFLLLNKLHAIEIQQDKKTFCLPI